MNQSPVVQVGAILAKPLPADQQAAPGAKPAKRPPPNKDDANPRDIKPSAKERRERKPEEQKKLFSDTPPPGEHETPPPGEHETPPPGENETPPPGEHETPPPGENESPGETNTPAHTLDDLAEQLQVDVKQLYDIGVPMGGDVPPMSLGELKDAYNTLLPLATRLESIDIEASKVRTERTQAIQQLDNIVAHIPSQFVTPQYLAAVTEHAKVIAAQEAQKLVEVLPEWANPLTYQAARADMVELVANYGLTSTDIDNIVDHRWIRALHELSELRKLNTAAARAVKKIPVQASRQSRTKPAQPVARGEIPTQLAAKAKAGDRVAQSDAVSRILARKR